MGQIIVTIVEINTVNFGSTGKIMLGIQNVCEENHLDCYCFAGVQRKNKKKDSKTVLFGSYIGYLINYGAGFYSGYESCFSYFSTKILLRHLNRLHPDIIQLHNLHGTYINYELLFKYIKDNNITVFWTLHDCWAFTGQCPHFQISNCDQWKTGCSECKYPKNQYPKTNRNVANRLWEKKMKSFSGVHSMTLVTPSKWLAGLVAQSFLKDYPIRIINNGINLDVFKPIDSDFKKRLGDDKTIVLGVSFGWNYKKGLDVFIKLARILPDSYRIVLVGTNEQVDKDLPSNIVSIHQTQDQKELAAIYSAADVFLNPTREDTFPTVNMEAIACGCPVITFNTGGSPEIITKKTGIVLQENTVEEAYKAIMYVCENNTFKREDCIELSRSFDMKNRLKEYVDLYKNTLL